ncbi:proline--tRNA ligase [Histomonas meleagridis]|uniref:proline--tRNA ligase n=1 Tax=Histomonas meleagridis TaxID=135588 RepID=UPI003559AFB8|nr:proline--tRNA ligase [Histomonas meleagridis]KAH0797843.1 proline--tRNA ligase [Histomonas meleagridis]
MIDQEFIDKYQAIIRLGLVDDRYPLDHTTIQLPNGWYGINSILEGFGQVLHNKFEYDEMLVPTISTKAQFKSIPEAIKGDLDEKVLKITHTGLTKLNDPFYLSYHPELVVPQIEKLTTRSYRDLPVRRLLSYFRYCENKGSVEVSLITDREYPAIDAEGIFATEEEYNKEIEEVTKEFTQFLSCKLHLYVFTAEKDNCVKYYAVLPDLTILEVACLHKYGKELSAAIEFQVLEANNKFAPPYIFDLNITSKMFAAIVANNSEVGKVILPSYLIRSHGTSYGVDITNLKNVRIDTTNKPFTADSFKQIISEGQLFALKPADAGKVTLVLENGEETIDSSALENKLNEIIKKHDEELDAKAKAQFEERVQKAVISIDNGSKAPEGYVEIGIKNGEQGKTAYAKPFLPL